jgi:hypothetical protein
MIQGSLDVRDDVLDPKILDIKLSSLHFLTRTRRVHEASVDTRLRATSAPLSPEETSICNLKLLSCFSFA